MKHRFLLFVAVGLLLGNPVQAFVPALRFDPELAAKKDNKFDKATYWKLQALFVSVNWQSASFQTVLADLTSKSLEVDPDCKGISFFINLKGGDQTIAKLVPDKVEMSVSDVSLFAVLQYISLQTHLIPLIHKDTIIFVPGNEDRVSMKLPTNFKQPEHIR